MHKRFYKKLIFTRLIGWAQPCAQYQANEPQGPPEQMYTLVHYFFILVVLTITFCGFWFNRTLLYFPLSVRPSVCLSSVTGVTYQLFSIF